MTIASQTTKTPRAARPTETPAGPLPLELDRTDLSRLAEAVDADGLAAHPTGVLHLAEAARSRGLSAVVLGVLLDGREPEVARLRAFSVAARHMLTAA